MLREFEVIIEQDKEGHYVASVPELPGCHTQALTLDELMDRVKEAIQLCCYADLPAPEEPSLRFVGVRRLSVDA